MISQQKTLKTITKIYESARNCELKPAYFEMINEELSVLSIYLSTTKKQAFFAAIIFGLQHSSYSNDLGEMARYLKCSPLLLLESYDDFERLKQLRISTQQRSRGIQSGTRMHNYSIHHDLIKAIIKNEAAPVKEENYQDITEVLEKIDTTITDQEDVFEDSEELLEAVKEVIDSNMHFPLIKRISQLQLPELEAAMLYCLIWKQINGRRSTDLDQLAEGLIDRKTKKIRFVQAVITGDNELVKKELIEIENARFYNDVGIKLTDKSVQMLNENGIKLFKIKKEENGVIEPKNIVKRELIFGGKELEQLQIIEQLLVGNKLNETQERLIEKGMPKGIVILFHGVAGTGKTESVYQIARKSNREIMKVDISSSKSKWFGESEKIIKQVFTNYGKLMEDSSRVPILLINEADAILSVRQPVGASSVSQTQNAIQNILLQELEDFQGILMATTNLTENLDSAFERRFLFKVKFGKPSIAVMAKIWKLKMPNLSTTECMELANRYDYSGGQIDNIRRKGEINEVIHGSKVSFEQIIQICKEEGINGGLSAKLIGF